MRIGSRFSIDFTPLALCLLLATALWLYASMREEYNTVIDVPLEIRLPAGRALETETVTVIRAQVQGAGWQLVNHFLSSAIRCVIDIPEKRIKQGGNQGNANQPTNSNNTQTANPNQAFVSISRQMLSQAIQAPVGVLVQRVLSDSLVLAIGTIAEKRVPITAVLDVEPREGFVVTPSYRLTPDSITIRSSKTMLNRINAWKTEPITLRDVYESVSIQTELSDTLAGVVQFPRSTILCALNVQQMGEAVIQDIPVVILGAPMNSTNKLLPMRVSVTLRGGIEDIARLAPENVRVSVEYSEIISTQSGFLKPSVYAPSGVQVVGIYPRAVRIMRSVSGRSFL
jgi:hypothetical protein